MTKLKRTSGKRKNGIVKLKIVVEKLQKSLLLGRKSACENDEFKEVSDSTYVPAADVKEGHFVVIAVDDDEPKRFVVPLNFLTHPTFLKLLEQAAEEYGFDQEGALTIPCRPSELESILAEQWQKEGDSSVGVPWGSWKTMVKSC
ncbi:auxin-responsive protein SAUR50-like [Vitis riparia]|uniref:auxin-responsive protein SAUR50-like n=1 Tax=Vitis riparia TaxID=96939 RepID=UPI00155AA269|nr:auxin-responsive protein SAUR50-like [Vitis riparia]